MNEPPTSRPGPALAAGLLSAAVLLTGCASGEPAQQPTPAAADGGHAGHEGMDHPADGGPPPAGISEAPDPTYPAGTQVVLAADHMAGMDGATATVVGAYDTFTYAVDFTPTGGGEPVLDHRWVVQEELADAGEDRLADGSEVTLAAEHMTGMDGAGATVASSTDETVYVVDFEAEGMTMTNHKWVVESEMQPA